MEQSNPQTVETQNPTEPATQTQLINLNELELDTVLRSKTLGCYKVAGSKAWGRFLSKIPDPEGITIPKKIINNFTLKADFPKIPAEQWSAYISLCFYMCPPGTKKLSTFEHDSQLEVGAYFLRDQATLSKWKIVVAKQIVNGVEVRADLRKTIDIVTGEEYEMFPPVGWLHAGSTHSHNTMKAFYSSIDDTSELSVPGLHIVVGEIDHCAMEYTHIASIVLQKQRKAISLYDVVDTEPKENCPFHPKVLSYIDVVVQKNKKLWAKSDDSPFPRFRGFRGPLDPGSYRHSGQISTTIPVVEDDTGKLNSFYRFLDRNNSDLFDNLDDNVDISTLTDDDLKILASEDKLIETLAELPEDVPDSVIEELILQDLNRMERNDEI